MSSLTSGLVPLKPGRSATTSTGGSIASLSDAPAFSKPSNSAYSKPSKFTKAASDDSDDDLDALFDDEPKIIKSSASNQKSTTKTSKAPVHRKFKSTMKDLSDSDDNYNFDDSLSSATSPSPKKPSSSTARFNDTLSPMSEHAPSTSSSPGKGNPLMENVSFASEDLEDSILGGLVGGDAKKSAKPAAPATEKSSYSFKLPSAKGSTSTSASTTTRAVEEVDASRPFQPSKDKDKGDFDSGGGGGGGGRHATSPLNSDDAADEDMGAFIPSFLEAGRQPRPRRLAAPATSTSTSSIRDKDREPAGGLDELDRVLGISSSIGGSAARSAAAPKDPFANAKPPTPAELPSSTTLRPSAASRQASILAESSDSDEAPATSAAAAIPARQNKEIDGPAAQAKVSFNLPQLGASPNKPAALPSTATTTSKSAAAAAAASSAAASPSSRRAVVGLTVNTEESPSTSRYRTEEAYTSSSTTPAPASAPTPVSNLSSATSPKYASRQASASASSAVTASSPKAAISYPDPIESPGVILAGKASASHMSPVVEREREKDRAIMSLQQKLEATGIEREAVERNLRLEVDSLRARLAISSEQYLDSPSGANAGAGAGAGGADLQAKLMRELADSKRTIAHLDQEIGRLKDEATLQALRQHEELKFAKERAAVQVEETERRYTAEMATAESRHDMAVQALKKLHNEEILAIKERSKDGHALETLAAQIRSSTGSMKLIEEQLSIKYKGAELVKEGQLEARERLIRDMEEKARERADLAEAESFRLKGLLVHMEQMVTGLRAQTSEDKDRLRMEHSRLQTMQTALEGDRAGFNRRVEEEAIAAARKHQELQSESRRIAEEKREASREIVEAKTRLEDAKSEFANHVAASTRAVEAGVARLKEEDKRLSAAREELQQARVVFEQRREASMRELNETESRCKALLAASADLSREKEAIQQAAREVQRASDNLDRRDEELEAWQQDLTRRESSLEKRSSDIRKVSTELQRREADMSTLTQVLGTQQLALVKMDHEVVQRTADFSTSHRESLRRQANKAFEEASDDKLRTPVGNIGFERNDAIDSSRQFQLSSRNGWVDINHLSQRNQYSARTIRLEDIDDNSRASHKENSIRNANSNKGQVGSAYHPYGSRELSAVEEELERARRSLLSARSSITKGAHLRTSTSDFLSREKSFIETVTRNRMSVANKNFDR